MNLLLTVFVAWPLYLLAQLPFRILYGISDFLYLLLYTISKYRVGVVRDSLKKSFPEKTDTELNTIERKYYRHLCDLIMETIKVAGLTREDLEQRCILDERSRKMLDAYHKQNKTVILISGHNGNWEWNGPAIQLQTPYQLFVSYRPLSNHFFDTWYIKLRTRLGVKVMPVQDVLRTTISNKKNVIALGFISDMTPHHNHDFWMHFMGREAPVFTGSEKIARKFGYPVIFVHMTKSKRGHYQVSMELITDDPASLREGELTAMHTRILEADIRQEPHTWLWTHKRWKHKRSAEQALFS